MARVMDIKMHAHDFEFSRNWFRTRNLATFREHIYPKWTGKPIVYLELGVFEGMSAVWMLQHVLTNPESRAVLVDPHLMTTKIDEGGMEAVRLRALHNTKPWKYQLAPMEGVPPLWKCELIRGNSAEVLRKMCGSGLAGIGKNTVDLCMIDGNHNDLAVLDDARHVLQLVKPGGWILFDDVENDKEKQDHVKQGLQMWLDETIPPDGSPQVQFLWKHGYMECFLKM